MGTSNTGLSDLLDSFELALRAAKKSPRTITNYRSAAEIFDEFALAHRSCGGLLGASKPDIQAWMVALLESKSTSTAATRFRCLQQVYRWLVEEELLDSSPMEGLSPPKLDEKVVPILADAEIAALIAACKGTDFEDRRDMALVRFMIDTGTRLGEVVGMTAEETNPKSQEAVVHGKGDRSRRVYFAASTAVELDRYRRLRSKHSWAASPALWLGVKGPLTDSGVTQLLRRRAAKAGIGHLHPHMLRHTWAHLMKVGGMPDDEVMQLGGWRTAQMLSRYGASATSERARTTYDRIAPGDRF